MRRQPVYFIIDASSSMGEEPIKQIQNGMRSIIQELRTVPYALETVFVSVISFAEKAKIWMPLTSICDFNEIESIHCCNEKSDFKSALICLMSDIDRFVVKTTTEQKGDWRPIIFLFTNSYKWEDADIINHWDEKFKKSKLIVVLSGESTVVGEFCSISDAVVQLKNINFYNCTRFISDIRYEYKYDDSLANVLENKSNLF